MRLAETATVDWGASSGLLRISGVGSRTLNVLQRMKATSGYELVARLPEFYDPGDDKLVYVRKV